MKGDFQARFCGNVGVRLPCVTRLESIKKMRISVTFLILFFAIGQCLSQTVNQIYLLGQAGWEEGEMLFVMLLEENNHYQTYLWNITTHEIGPPGGGKYNVVKDTITLQPADSSQESVEYLISRVKGINVLRQIGKEYNPDGSLATIWMDSILREELGDELIRQLHQDLCKN